MKLRLLDLWKLMRAHPMKKQKKEKETGQKWGLFTRALWHEEAEGRVTDLSKAKIYSA